jgi:hypothetical protein
MPRPGKYVQDSTLLAAALEGLELQKQRVEEQIQQVRSMLGGKRPKAAATAEPESVEKPARRRQLSEASRKRIAAAQKRRWAAYRKGEAAKAK